MRPKLTFNDSIWNAYELKDIVSFSKGKNVSLDIVTETGFPAMMYGDIYIKYDTFFNKVDYCIPIELSKDSTIIDKNTILMTCTGETAIDIGKSVCYLGETPICIGGDILALKCTDNTNAKFLCLQLNTYDKIKERARLSQGHSVVHLYQHHIEKSKIYKPDIATQTKIATFLNLYYKKIELQKKKIEQYKIKFINLFKFLLSNLKLFEVKPLGSLCEITTGKLDANAMVNNGKYKFFTCAKEVYNIDKFAFDTEALLISGNGANVGYIHYFKGKFNAYQRTYILDSFADNIQYIKMYLEINLPKRIKAEKNEGNTPYIVLSTLTEMNILVPAKDIQDRLSECYLLFNQKINLEQQKLELLEKYKQGLLQKLFI